MLFKLDAQGAGSSPKADPRQLRVSILQKAFDVYDKDRSGTIDHEELRKLFQDLGWPIHDEFLERAVRVLDEDMSGEIDFSEFQNWTEFAYASRILYRSEMMPTTPRRAAFMTSFLDSDEEEGLSVRRLMSLDTVHEHKETGPHDNNEVQAVTKMATRRDEMDAERKGELYSKIHLSDKSFAKKAPTCGPQSNRIEEVMCDSSSEAKGFGQLLRTEVWRTARKQRGNAMKVSFQCEQGPAGACSKSGDSSCHEEEIGLETNAETDTSGHEGAEAWKTQEKVSVRQKATEVSLTKEKNTRSVDISEWLDSKSDGTNDGMDFGLPIKRMATMTLGTPKRGRLQSSRVRSQSMVALPQMSSRLWTRTESKMTVRMRCACGQFQDDSEDEEDVGSNEVQKEVKDSGDWADRPTEAKERAETGTLKRARSDMGMARMGSSELRRVESE